MRKPPEFADYKVTRPGRMMATVTTPSGWYSTGYVVTPHGVVGVYTEPNFTSLCVVHDGREYRGWWRQSFTERGLVTLCKRFARDVVGLT